MHIDIIYIIYIVFAVAAIAAFATLPVQRAALLVYFGGWLFLPVGHYPQVPIDVAAPFWIVGSALPSDMLVSKAWIVPVAALSGTIIIDHRRFRTMALSVADIPMALWCFWPLLQALFVNGPVPSPVLATLYLSGSWGASWLLGRILFAGGDGQIALVRGLILATLLLLPIALLEGIAGPQIYNWLYHRHPFVTDGAERYVGYRPLALFEHGNQYGIWITLGALAAIWFARTIKAKRRKIEANVVASLLAIAALAAQSVGAILLALIGLGLLSLAARPLIMRRLTIVIAAASLFGGLLYVSGAVPVTQIARDTKAGQIMLGAVRATGRGSLTWRISQDQKALALIKRDLAIGSGTWDWWRPVATRPWGLPLLIIGQFGLIGLGLTVAATVSGAFRRLAGGISTNIWSREASDSLLAVIIVLAMADALLNAFIYFPALLAAGAIAQPRAPAPDQSG
jgi:hypothetical protein